jgi:DNA-binding Lrp family transcriptional regulator
MLQAYILILTQAGATPGVAKVIAGIDGVTSVSAVNGPYDIIAVAEAADIDELGQIIFGKIHAVAGITRTLTCPVVKP